MTLPRSASFAHRWTQDGDAWVCISLRSHREPSSSGVSELVPRPPDVPPHQHGPRNAHGLPRCCPLGLVSGVRQSKVLRVRERLSGQPRGQGKPRHHPQAVSTHLNT